MSKYTLVVVEHPEAKCPLRQQGPDWALRLAANLEHANPTGFFEQQEHKGGIIFARTNHDELASALTSVLPEHVEPEIRDVEVDDSSLVATCAQKPELLDGSSDDPEAFGRLVGLAQEFDNFFPERGLTETERLGHKRISLHDLPAYLRQNAPAT